VVFLYWDALRSVHALARAAGLQMFTGDHPDDGAAVARALARTALDLPNPVQQLFGVNPRREVSGAYLLGAAALYKCKVALSNLLVKELLGRLLGRSLMRHTLAFVALPVTAMWTAAVCWSVMREARIRVMGPSAAHEFLEEVFAGQAPLSERGRLEAQRAVASSIVRTHELHPNLVVLLRGVHKRLGGSHGEVLDDSHVFLSEVPRLPPGEQSLVLRVLAVAAAIDGKIVAAERRLLRRALAACGRAADDAPAQRLCEAFVRGEVIPAAAVRALVP
jgi:hypothetical protein